MSRNRGNAPRPRRNRRATPAQLVTLSLGVLATVVAIWLLPARGASPIVPAGDPQRPGRAFQGPLWPALAAIAVVTVAGVLAFRRTD